MSSDDRQFWNTSYTPKEETPEMAAWRRFLIERGYTPEGVWRSGGKQKMKELIKEFLGVPAKEGSK